MSFTKDELRDKLIGIKDIYIEERKEVLDKIRPIVDKRQISKPDLLKIEPIIEFCESKEQQEIWYYLRNTVSVAPFTGEVGRRFRWLIADKNTNFILGFAGLASSLTIPILDKHIGWTKEQKWKNKKINNTMVMAHCFHPDNKVILANGNIKSVGDLIPGDLVFSINKTGNVEIKPVLWVSKKRTNEKILKIITRSNGKVLVTENHHMIGLKRKTHLERKKQKGWDDFLASELEVGDVLPLPYRSNLFKKQYKNSKDYFDYDYRDVTRRVKESFKIHVKMDDMIKFAGWYLSEGCTTATRVDIGQSPNSKYYKEVIKFVQELCDQLGSNYHLNANHITISNSKFARFVKDTFGVREQKRIPQFVFDNNIELFLETYIKGDGHTNHKVTGNIVTIPTVSPKLAEQLSSIGYILNYGVSVSYKDATVTERKDRGFQTCGRYVYRKPIYYIRLKSTKVKKYNDIYYDRIRSIEIIDTPKYVVDFEVEDNHTVLVGNEFNFIFCGQCVSTPDFSKYLTGKLVALSCKSEEVITKFETEYKDKAVMFMTTSLFGKSAIYNRLEGFEYLGLTKGSSATLIPPDIKRKAREAQKIKKGKYGESYTKEDGTVVNFGHVKVYQYAGKQEESNKRGVYIIPLAHNYKEFLCCKEEIPNLIPREPFNTLVDRWKKRWFEPRIERLENSNEEDC